MNLNDLIKQYKIYKIEITQIQDFITHELGLEIAYYFEDSRDHSFFINDFKEDSSLYKDLMLIEQILKG